MKKSVLKPALSIYQVFMGVIFGIALMYGIMHYTSSSFHLQLKGTQLYSYGESVFKIVFAFFIGSIIGMERENKNRPAGLRTHALVSIGSALVMIVSFEMFESYSHLANFDPARLGAQVISGIGFLGAGTIIRNGVTVKGLTTAASLWVVAAVGLAIGSGQYIVSVVSTAVVIFTLKGLEVYEKRYMMKNANLEISICTIDKPGQIGLIGQFIGRHNIVIKKMDITSDDDKIEENDEESSIVLNMLLKVPSETNLLSVLREMEAISGIMRVDVIENKLV